MSKQDNDAIQVVERFLQALEKQDHPTIEALLAPNLIYSNVSLPTLKGGKLVSKVFKLALGRATGFQVKNHNIAANGNTVITERTDIINIGPLHIGFWVCGTFKVEEGKIKVWRDYFDWLAMGKATARGVIGIAVPKLRPTLAAPVEL